MQRYDMKIETRFTRKPILQCRYVHALRAIIAHRSRIEMMGTLKLDKSPG